jgi:hypothetical protein
LTLAVAVGLYNSTMVAGGSVTPAHLMFGGLIIAGEAYFSTGIVPVPTTGGQVSTAIAGLQVFVAHYGAAAFGGIIAGSAGGYLVLRAMQYAKR